MVSQSGSDLNSSLSRDRLLEQRQYGDELKAEYVVPLAEMAPPMLPAIRQAIATFRQWLEQQATLDSDAAE